MFKYREELLQAIGEHQVSGRGTACIGEGGGREGGMSEREGREGLRREMGWNGREVEGRRGRGM